MNKQKSLAAVVAVVLAGFTTSAFAGPVVVIKGIQCTPYSVLGVTYPGCPGDAPPPAQDAYLVAKQNCHFRQ